MNEQPNPQAQAQTAEQAPPAQADATITTSIRKRQQIKNTNKNIFLWLTGAAIIVSVCLVALQFLVREFMFNQEIINQKSETNKTLIANKAEAEKLRENINNLLADSKLNRLKYEAANTETTALSVILDALPTDGDVTAFANSLQATVLARSGVSIRELTTTTMNDPLAIADESAPGGAAATIPFNAGFNGSYLQVTNALIHISQVIRPIDLNVLTIRAGEGDDLQVSTEGVTYYLPPRTVEVTTEVRQT